MVLLTSDMGQLLLDNWKMIRKQLQNDPGEDTPHVLATYVRRKKYNK